MASAVNAVETVAGQAVGTALSGPTSMISSFVNLGKDLIDRFVPDPQAKLAAQMQLANQAAALQMAQIDQQDKMMAAASRNIANDPKMSSQRAYFCGGITTMLLMNYTGLTGVITGLVNKWVGTHMPGTFDIPPLVLMIFAIIMLGFAGMPFAANLIERVAGMPGDSQVKLPFGLGSIGNKS